MVAFVVGWTGVGLGLARLLAPGRDARAMIALGVGMGPRVLVPVVDRHDKSTRDRARGHGVDVGRGEVFVGLFPGAMPRPSSPR